MNRKLTSIVLMLLLLFGFSCCASNRIKYKNEKLEVKEKLNYYKTNKPGYYQGWQACKKNVYYILNDKNLYSIGSKQVIPKFDDGMEKLHYTDEELFNRSYLAGFEDCLLALKFRVEQELLKRKIKSYGLLAEFIDEKFIETRIARFYNSHQLYIFYIMEILYGIRSDENMLKILSNYNITKENYYMTAASLCDQIFKNSR